MAVSAHLLSLAVTDGRRRSSVVDILLVCEQADKRLLHHTTPLPSCLSRTPAYTSLLPLPRLTTSPTSSPCLLTPSAYTSSPTWPHLIYRGFEIFWDMAITTSHASHSPAS